MTLSLVRTKLAAICTGTTAPANGLGLSSSFTHASTSGDTNPPTVSRSFYFAVDAMAGRGPYTPGGGGNRRFDTVRLVVVYPADADDAAIENAISADYDALTTRLLDASLWDPLTSTIVSVTEQTDLFLPATILREPTANTLTITLSVEHTR